MEQDVYIVEIDEQNRITLPQDVVDFYKLKAQDSLYLTTKEDDYLNVLSHLEVSSIEQLLINQDELQQLLEYIDVAYESITEMISKGQLENATRRD